MRGFGVIALLMLLQPEVILAAAPDEPWFNPPGGTWAPGTKVIAAMKSDFDSAIKPLLATEPSLSARPTRYWFQYQGQGPSSRRIVELIGYPFPVPEGARKAFLSVHIPEASSIYARYLPLERRFELLNVGPDCPPRI